MSTFNDVDIFYTDTYPSKVTISPFSARNIYTTIPGVNGAFSEHLGIGPRKIVLEGVLGASTLATLVTRISTILGYVDQYNYTFVDNNSNTYYYCQLESFAYGNVPGGQNSRWTYNNSQYITYYRATFLQLSPHTSEP